jgi:hypothetical protein
MAKTTIPAARLEQRWQDDEAKREQVKPIRNATVSLFAIEAAADALDKGADDTLTDCQIMAIACLISREAARVHEELIEWLEKRAKLDE